MTYDQARDAIPENAEWSCSFGYPGQGGFKELFRAPCGKLYEIGNGKWDDFAPFTWAVREV